jgi:hypothetical protein
MIPDDATPDLAGIRQVLIEVAARKMAQTLYSPAVTSAVRERAALVVDAVLARLEIVGFLVGEQMYGQLPPKSVRDEPRELIYRFRVES